MVWIDAPILFEKSSGVFLPETFQIPIYENLNEFQAHFVKALEMSVDVANLQSELGGVQARLKFLRRSRSKAVEETEVEEGSDIKDDVIENIDSSFSTNLSLEG